MCQVPWGTGGKQADPTVPPGTSSLVYGTLSSSLMNMDPAFVVLDTYFFPSVSFFISPSINVHSDMHVLANT